jgi:hypothetical protein
VIPKRNPQAWRAAQPFAVSIDFPKHGGIELLARSEWFQRVSEGGRVGVAMVQSCELPGLDLQEDLCIFLYDNAVVVNSATRRDIENNRSW